MSDVRARLRQLQEVAQTSASPKSVAAAKEIIDLLVPLAEANPAEHRSELAQAWGQYGAKLSWLEGPAAALPALATSLQLAREVYFADQDPLTLTMVIDALREDDPW